MSIYDKIETENPLLDEIIYNCKLLVKNCILKNESAANDAETVQSLRSANIYISIIEGRCKYEYFDYEYDDFKLLGVSTLLINSYLDSADNVPSEIKIALINKKSTEFINNYVEQNNYYRKLCGLPDINADYIYLTEDDASYLPEVVDISIPVHKFNNSIKYEIEEYGVLDILIERYPEYKYLKFLNRAIISYNARKVNNFGLVYINSAGVEPIILARFRELIEKNRVYIIKTVDSEAYRFYSDYYDEFLMMMIIVQTVIDMVNELPEYYIRRDIFDIRTIEYFFEANGVEFFPSIPLKYQKALVKNLNKLIKYKSTTTNIIDICSLFGFSNVEVFKYYLCKHRKINEETGTYQDTGIIVDDYELKFLKVPLEGIADETAKNKSNFLIYDTVVSGDQYWDGPYSHDYVKNKILEHEFNMVKSKYISIDTVYSITDASFEMSYFINMLMFNNISKDQLTLSIPILNVSDPFKLVDIFIFLYSLMYEYNGVTDNIVVTPSGYLKVKGFNFDVNMTTLQENMLQKGYTLEDLGVSGFQAPKSGIFTFSQLISIFINNRDIYNHLIYEMEHADNKDIYEIYSNIYDSLMVTDLNFDYYYISELGRIAETYSEYLQYKNVSLYDKIIDIREILDLDIKSKTIYNLITNIAAYITDYLDSDGLKHIFANLPTESGEYIKNYMYKIINFFKSYKISILDIQTIYKLDRENKVSIFDDIWFQHYFIKKQIIPMIDKETYIAHISRNEDLYRSIDEWIYNSVYNPDEKEDIYEKIMNILVTVIYSEHNPTYEEIFEMYRHYDRSYIQEKNIIDTIDYASTLVSTDMYNYIMDKCSLSSSISPNELYYNQLKDSIQSYISSIITHTMYDGDVYDTLKYIICSIFRKDKYTIDDNIFINPYYI